MTTRGLYHDRPRAPRPEGSGPTAQEIGRAALERIFAMLAARSPESMTRAQQLGVLTYRFDPAERFTIWRDMPPTWTAIWTTAGGENIRTEPQASREHALDCAEIMLGAGFAPPSASYAAQVQGRPWLELVRECGGSAYTGWRAGCRLYQPAAGAAGAPRVETPDHS
jgi:hypothetical protein